MGRMDLDEVESDLLASFDGGDESILNPLNVVLGHRDGLRVIIPVGDVARTINYPIEWVNKVSTTK